MHKSRIVAESSESDRTALEQMLDAFCREVYWNARRSRQLLSPLDGVMFDPDRAPERRAEIEALCHEAELWVRKRYEQQVGETIIAKRLAYLAEREEGRLNNLISAIVLARRAARGVSLNEKLEVNRRSLSE